MHYADHQSWCAAAFRRLSHKKCRLESLQHNFSGTEDPMASKTLFKSNKGPQLPKTDTVNEAGGIAYQMPPKHALAQYAATGCLGHTYYASAETQLSTVLSLARAVAPEYVARTALYARQRGYMKDLP